MVYEYAGGGIEALLDGILGEPKNETLVAAKYFCVEKAYAQKISKQPATGKATTLGIENFFPLENPELADEYFQLVGGFKVEDYPVYRPEKIDKHDTNANTFFWWRAYTLTRIAQFLDLKNYPRIKKYASTNLLAAICNCTQSSVGTVLGELSRHGPKHAQIFIKDIREPAELGLYGTALYQLTEEPPGRYIARLRKKLEQFSPLLNKYDKFIKRKIELIMKSGLVSEIIPRERKRQGGEGVYWVRPAHISGREKNDFAKDLHARRYLQSLMG